MTKITPCTIEDMTADASIHGNIIEVENYDGTKKFMASQYRQPILDSIFCSNCGASISTDSGTVNEDVRKHLEAN